MIEKTRCSIIATALILSFFLCSIAFAADTYTYGFEQVLEDNETTNTANGLIGKKQLSFVVSHENDDLVSFTFYNSGPDACSITDIYFDDNIHLLTFATGEGNGGFLYSPVWNGETGVEFTVGAKPEDLPGGENLDPAFTSDYSYDPDSSKKGVNPGEWVKLYFTLNGDYYDLIAALEEKSFRVGIHVQSFVLGPDGSEAFVNSTPGVPTGSSGGAGAVPEPATFLLLGFGLLGAAGISRKKISKNVLRKTKTVAKRPSLLNEVVAK